MRLGVVYDGQRNFLEEILADWQTQFDTSIFQFSPVNFPIAKGRINPRLHRRALKRFIERQDAVFFEWVGENLVVASRLGTHTPILARLHSWEIFHHAPQVNWSGVTRVALVSEAMRKRFAEQFPQHADKAVVIPAGKSLTQFQPSDHPFCGKIAMLANLLPIKRIYEAVLAVAALNRRGYRFTLHVAGKPESGFNNQRYYASLLSAVQKLGLQDQVIFEGWVDAAQWLPQMDIFVSNSFWEGQQNALIEAMACGRYCLCHFWDGADEILPGEYLYDTENDLVEKIIAYSQMPEGERQKKQSEMRRLAVEKYNLPQAIEKYRAFVTNAAQH